MSEMIERVARAIAAAEGYDIDGLKAYVESSSVSKKDYERLMAKARAAIEAMRDPTAEVLHPIAFPMDEDQLAGKALQRAKGTAAVFPKVEVEIAVGQWQRAIDAALSE